MIGIGGIRAFALSKYLPCYGWNPIILTITLPGDPDPGTRVIQTHYEDVIDLWKKRFGQSPEKSLNDMLNLSRKKNAFSIADRFVSVPREIITYPDEKKGWYTYAVTAGDKILMTEKIDAILSTSPPAITNLIAKTLAEKYQVPWLADFRDLWSRNHYMKNSVIWNSLEKKLEKKTIKLASAVTTVSQPLVEKLAELHGPKKIFSITNGFDPDLLSTQDSVDTFFRIVYTGVLYEGKRDPTPLFVLLDDLCNKGFIQRDDVKIDFFGIPEDWIQTEIEKNHLEKNVISHGHVSHDIAVSRQRNAQLLLLLTWDNPEEKGVYTGKLFEYLAARRPILSFGYSEGGVVKDLLLQTQAGVHAGNEEELKTAILQAYHEYKEFGAVQYRGIDTEVLKYSHKEMARNFADVLDSITP